MPISFTQTSYFRLHHGVDKYLLERIIFPEFQKQAPIAGGSRGIQLPTGENQPEEYISLEEAKQLILDWLINTKNLPESKQTEFKRIKSYEKFSEVSYDFYQAKVKTPSNLATPARINDVAALQNSNKNVAVTDYKKFDADKTMKLFNETYMKVLTHSYSGNPARILKNLFPEGVAAGSDITQMMLAQVIAQNLSRLEKAGSLSSSPERQDHAVSQELARIINSKHKELSSYLNYMGDRDTQSNLRRFTNSLSQSVKEDDPEILSKLESLEVEAANKLDRYLLNESELRQRIFDTLPLSNTNQKALLADSILKEAVRSSLSPKGISALLDQVSADLKIGQSEKAVIERALVDTGLSVSLDYRQNELQLLVNSRELTRGEINLIKKGINPFLTTQNTNDISQKENKILSNYNGQSINQGRSFTTLRDAYNNELQKDNPDPVFIEQARAHLNRVTYFQSLNSQDQARVERTRFGRWFTNTRSRVYELQNQFFDKWTDVEETVTGKRWLTKQLDRWDSFAEKFTFKVGKVNVPIFRLQGWVLDQWDKLKQKSTLDWLTAGKSKYTGGRAILEPFRSTINWSLKHYELGGFTVKGATFVAAHAAWSKTIYWASGKIVKDGAIFAARTATRFLIKVGGKALARSTVDAIIALAGTATVVGSVLSVVAILDLITSIGKAAWGFLQRLVPNKEALVAGMTTVWAAIAGISLAPLLFAAAVPIITVLAIGLGSVAFMQIYQNNFNFSTYTDSGPIGTLIANSSTTIDCFNLVESGKSFPKNDPENGNGPTEGWSASETETIKAAIETMKSTYGNFIEAICQGGDINLWRDSHTGTDWGGWAMTGSDIRLYNLGVSSALYTLAHEFGHIYAARVGGVSEFSTMGFVTWDTTGGGCRNNIYPAKPTYELQCYGENFAELISWVISGHKTPPSNWATWIISKIQKGGK